MKMTILSLFTLTMLRLQAAVDPLPSDGDWDLKARKAQAELNQHQFALAAESAGQALGIAKRFGDGDPRIAVTYYQLGTIFRDWGHCTEARASQTRSIAAWGKVAHPEPDFVFNSTIALIDTLCECGQFDAAEKTLRSFDSRLQIYLSDPVKEAQVLAVRGAILRSKKKYVAAESSYRRAIQLLEHAPGATAFHVEEQRVSLANILDKQGRHEEALSESMQVIAFLDRTGVSRPLMLAGSLNNAACSLADLGRKEEAARMFERALAVAAEALGEDHRFTARIMLNYARVLRETRQTPAAEAMQKKGSQALRHALVRDGSTVDISDLR